MITRLAVGLGGLAVLLPALFLGGQIAVMVVVSLALLVGLDEYSRMAVPDDHWRALGVLLVGGGLVYGHMLWGDPAQVTMAVAAASIFTLLASLFMVKQTTRAADVAARLLMGLLYLPLLIAFIVWVRRLDHGLAWLFVLLGSGWMGDTGAYFAGRALGRRKLFERVSPKKTWEGAIGGALAAVAWVAFVKIIALPALPWVHAIALGVVLDALGVLGDLTESMLKRSFGVKDSGRIMPGHGGILDRIDSLLLTAPVVWAWASFFGLG